MATITLRMTEEDARLIRRYAEMTGTTVSQFVRQAALDRIEDEYDRSALARYLEVVERGDFIPYREARRDWEPE
ncbi:MAG: Ribbon-helix-helix protein, copG family [Synergistetes bacterium ADurb.BinA166]|nr:MAG: Ribbon-helix-helix protein, copG family [Synergistetes bacterium ADurb.BinA166]